jgi:hypothetical protein
VIARIWRGLAPQARAGDYQPHYESEVSGHLPAVSGFRGAGLLRRDDGTEVMFTSITGQPAQHDGGRHPDQASGAMMAFSPARRSAAANACGASASGVRDDTSGSSATTPRAAKSIARG